MFKCSLRTDSMIQMQAAPPGSPRIDWSTLCWHLTHARVAHIVIEIKCFRESKCWRLEAG